MLALRYARKTRPKISPLLYSTASFSAPSSFLPSFSFPHTSPLSDSQESPRTQDILAPFKQWFLSRRNPLFDRIFEILDTQEGLAAFRSLRSLNLSLTEGLVLDVLNYGKTHKNVLSCVKFFDWVGRQREFSHTDGTFHAMFRILYKAKLSSIIYAFLDSYTKERYSHAVRFYDTLVIGYSVVGKPEIALEVFGRMRFQGTDLDSFAYHVLLNSLVEEGYFDIVPIVLDQIRIRGLECEITHSIVMKSFCKKKDLDKAEEYLRSLIAGDTATVNAKVVGSSGGLVGILVDALCRDKQFQRAGALIEEMKKVSAVPIGYAYSVWIRNLIQSGELDGALEFFKSKKEDDGYAPGVFQYNSLVCRLLRENKLKEVFDLLIEMKEQNVLPDEVTMNATLCFFCKAGMTDVALELYQSRAEFGLSVNSMAYNHLLNTLFGNMSIDKAYHVLKGTIDQGYFPGKKTFSIIADALCRESKLDEMKELLLAASERDFMPSYSIYHKFIEALCRFGKVEGGYEVHEELNRLNALTSRNTYNSLISGLNKTGKGDIAARLLIEMQEKGHKPNRKLFRAVVCRLCSMNDEEGQRQFFNLLESQLSCNEPTCDIYNHFIDGAGHARKPQLAGRVYQMMVESGISPSLKSDMLLLQSLLKGEKIVEALNFFHLSDRRKISKKLWNIMIVGLCKVDRPECALEIFSEMRKKKLTPSIECYEELVKVLCARRQYSVAFEIIDDMALVGRPMSSFIGNVLLLHSLYSREPYSVLRGMRNLNNWTPNKMMLGELIDAFSDSIKGEQDVEDLEVLIQRCFPLDIYTYNMLLRKISMTDVNHACQYFNQLPEKGYEPNRWSYDILVHCLQKLGRSAEAVRFAKEMVCKDFDLTEATKRLI